MSHEILIDANEDALCLARKAYVGARTECFFIGRREGDFYLLDVNSMYAAVMRDMAVPIRLRGFTRYATIDDLRKWSVSGVVIADVTVETDTACYPFKIADKLVFPTGTFRTSLSGAETLHALQHEAIKEVHAVAIYERAPAFAAFVNAMWARRHEAQQNGHVDDAARYKLLLASFYGKWGQSGGVWDKIDDAKDGKIKQWVNVDYATGEITEYRQFGGIVQQLGVALESADSHPAIAACITAGARMLLHTMIETAGRENVFYVDTDSLLVNACGLEALREYVAPSELGALKLEGAFHTIQIWSSKDYVFDARTRSKGVRSNAVLLKDGRFEQEEFKGLSAMCRSGDMSQATSKKIRKTIVRKYDKGVRQEDGRIEPICLR